MNKLESAEGNGLPTNHLKPIRNFPLLKLGTTRAGLLAVAVVAQLITVSMTWPLWQVRAMPPNLPVFEWGGIDFGIPVLVSALVVLVLPKPGIWIHFSVLLLASLCDQMRTQPQFLALWILMFAVATTTGTRVCRYFLISLWIWAGFHKFLSPDWFAGQSWDLVSSLHIDPTNTYLAFAIVVIVSEIGLGVVALLNPRLAAYGCPMLHFGIVIYLSPLFRDWNYSVIPWNLATGIIGFWILRYDTVDVFKNRWEAYVLAVFLIVPAGFYCGLMDHGYAHVLYSDNLPKGIITSLDKRSRAIKGWKELAVPFPNERRLLEQHFAKTAVVGEKLHIYDPRPVLPDRYFVMTDQGPTSITKDEFFAEDPASPMGIGMDPSRATFHLLRSGVRLRKATQDSMFHAVTISPESYSLEVLEWVAQLPNIREIQLLGASVSDKDLNAVVNMKCLVGIGLDDTALSDVGVKNLSQSKSLRVILHENTRVNESAILEFYKSRIDN